MKRFRNAAAIATAVLLAACQGSFSNGTSTPGGPVLPPTGASPAAVAVNASASPAADNGTYPFSQAAAGFKCPETQGFSCVLKFNIPPATPTPIPTATPKAKAKSKAKAKASSKARPKGKARKPTPKPRPTAKPTASPSPTPSPSPNASASPGASGSPAGSPSPSGSASPAAAASPSGANVTIKLDALPKDAPAMTNPDPKAVATTALLAVRMTVDADVAINGAASADFTLPQEQIGGRGFAVQLFEETHRKKKVIDHYLGSYAQSTLSGTTLHFALTSPAVTVKKGETWLLVLYGDERPSASASPMPSGSPAVSPSAAPSGSPATPAASAAP